MLYYLNSYWINIKLFLPIDSLFDLKKIIEIQFRDRNKKEYIEKNEELEK